MAGTVAASACALSPPKSAIAPAFEPAVHEHLVTRASLRSRREKLARELRSSDGRKENTAMKLDRIVSLPPSLAAACLAFVGLASVGGCVIPDDYCDRHP
jgi:hypothetical protein